MRSGFSMASTGDAVGPIATSSSIPTRDRSRRASLVRRRRRVPPVRKRRPSGPERIRRRAARERKRTHVEPERMRMRAARERRRIRAGLRSRSSRRYTRNNHTPMQRYSPRRLTLQTASTQGPAYAWPHSFLLVSDCKCATWRAGRHLGATLGNFSWFLLSGCTRSGGSSSGSRALHSGDAELVGLRMILLMEEVAEGFARQPQTFGSFRPGVAGCSGSTTAVAKGSMPTGRRRQTEDQDGIEAMVDRNGRSFCIGSHDGSRTIGFPGKRRH
jgi:hypothetical protein